MLVIHFALLIEERRKPHDIFKTTRLLVAMAVYRLFDSDIHHTNIGIRRSDCFRALSNQNDREKTMRFLTKRNFEVLLFLSCDDEVETSYKCTAYTIFGAKRSAQDAYPTGIIARVIGVEA
jgi:hypothetical protein